MNTDCIKKWLKENLTEKRYLHSLGTADMALELAKKYTLDASKAYITGLLHDCAKCETNEKLLEIIKNEISDIDICELKNYKTLHAPVSAYWAAKKFQIEDPEIISAIRWHTLGKLQMSNFESIIFLADKIERNTREEENSCQIFEILNKHEGEKGLKLALLECFNRTIVSLVKRQLEICSVTIDVYNELLEYKNSCL